MKKIRLVSVITVLVLIIAMFAGCNNASINDLYSKDKFKEYLSKENYVLTQVEKIDRTDRLVKSSGDIIVLSETSETGVTYNFYNSKTEQIIHTEQFALTDVVKVDFEANAILKNQVFTITKTAIIGGVDNYEISVYDETGKLLNKLSTNTYSELSDGDPEFNLDLLKIGINYYKENENGGFDQAFTVEKSSKIPKFTAKNGNYYYYINNTSSTFSIFDENLNLYAYHTVPTYAENVSYFILDDGNVLIQYLTQEPANSDNYTYYDSDTGNLVAVVTELYNTSRNSVKPLEVDHVIVELSSKSTIYASSDSDYFEFLNDGIKNLGTALEIKNKKLDITPILVSFNNSAGIDKYLNKIFVGQTFFPPLMVSEDRFVANNVYGERLLINSSGDKIGDVTSAIITAKYIIKENNIYDYDMNLIASCEGYEFVPSVNNLLMFSKMVDNKLCHYLFNNGEYKLVADTTNVQLFDLRNDKIIIVKNVETSKYTVYNENLDALVTTDTYLTYLTTTSDGKVILHGVNPTDLKTELYILSA